jgi:hypothetical protein
MPCGKRQGQYEDSTTKVNKASNKNTVRGRY